MLFPELINKKYCYININNESLKWKKLHPELFSESEKNPFLIPEISQKMINDIHLELSVDWSYGGYLEDRSNIWTGSYMEKNKNFIHLGIDFHVRQGTLVAVDYDSKVLIVDNDNDMDGGWGPRVILKPYLPQEKPIFLIYSHLQNIRCKMDDFLHAGDVLAEIGGPPNNGNWAPHLHVQAVVEKYLMEFIANDIYLLDGYGKAEEIEKLRETFPDPLEFIKI